MVGVTVGGFAPPLGAMDTNITKGKPRNDLLGESLRGCAYIFVLIDLTFA